MVMVMLLVLVFPRDVIHASAGGMSGTVLRGDGSPAVGVSVAVYEATTLISSMTTGSSGDFSLNGIGDGGFYRIVASDQNGDLEAVETLNYSTSTSPITMWLQPTLAKHLLYFDNDPRVGNIAGQLAWSDADNTENINEYEMYALDASGMPIGDRICHTGVNGDAPYYMCDFTPPAGAVRIGVVSVKMDGSRGSFASVPILDNPAQSETRDASLYGMDDLGFDDLDNHPGTIGGTLYWDLREGMSDAIIAYEAYFLDENDTKLKRIGIVYGQDHRFIEIPTGTAIPSTANRIGVFARSATGISVSYTSVWIWDAPYQAPRIHFYDTDPANDNVRGEITWTVADQEPAVDEYQIYWSNADYQFVLLTSTPKVAGQTQYTLSDLTVPLDASGLYLAYGKTGEGRSSLFRMNLANNTSGSSVGTVTVDGSLSPPEHVVFFDEDNSDKIGGSVNWYSPSSNTGITGYNAYFVDGNKNKLQPIVTTSGKYGIGFDLKSQSIPAGAVSIAVYSKSGTAESAQAGYARIWNNPIPIPQNAVLFDTNPQPGVITGKLTWNAIEDETLIDQYRIFYYDPTSGAQVTVQNVAVHPENPVYEIGDFPLPIDVHRLNLGMVKGNDLAPSFSVFTVADNTAAKTNLDAAQVSTLNAAQQASFYDYDPSWATIGGSLYWTDPANASGIAGYEAYFLTADNRKVKSIAAVQREATGSYVGHYTVSIPGGTAIPTLPDNTPATKIGIFSKDNTNAEGTSYATVTFEGTPVIVESDTLPSPLEATFTDMEENPLAISGTVAWRAAANETASGVVAYDLFYLDASGRKLQKIASVPSAGGSSYMMNLASVSLPSFNGKPPAMIGVFAKNISGAYSKKFTAVPIVDTFAMLNSSAVQRFDIGKLASFIVSGNATYSRLSIRQMLESIQPIMVPQ